MRLRELAALVLLAAIWGSSYLFIRVAVEPLGPVLVAFLRVVIGGAGLVLWAVATGQKESLVCPDRRFLFLGLMNAAIPYGLIAFAELHITASLAAILNATTPLFTAAVAATWAGERLSTGTWLGGLLGLGGVAVLVGWHSATIDAAFALAVVAMLGASLAYGLASVYAKQRLRGMSSLGAAAGQQMGAILVLAPFGLVSGVEKSGSISLGPGVTVAVLGLGLLCTSVAYLLYFHLISTTGAVRTSSVTFLIPVFGMLWSVLFLGEAVPPGALVGLLMILGGVGIVSGNVVRTWLGRLRPIRSTA